MKHPVYQCVTNVKLWGHLFKSR